METWQIALILAGGLVLGVAGGILLIAVHRLVAGRNKGQPHIDAPSHNTEIDAEGSPDINTPDLLRLRSNDVIKIGWPAVLKVCTIGASEAAGIISTTLLIRYAIDSLVMRTPMTREFLVLVGALIAAAAVGAIARSLEFSVSESIGYSYVNRLRMVMYGHLQRMPGRQLLNNSRGGVLLRFTGDLTMIRSWVSRGIAMLIVASIMVAAGIGILVAFQPLLAVVVVGILSMGVGVSLIVGARLKRSARAVRRQRSNLTTNLTEQIHSMATIQVLGRTAGEFDRMGRQSERLRRRLVNYARQRGWLRGISTVSCSLAVISVLVVGSFSVDANRMSIGTVVAAMLVVRQMLRPIRVLGLSNDYWQTAKVSREKVMNFLRQPYREVDATELDNLTVSKGLVEIKNVTLDGALNGINAEVQPRQIVAIMGPNGAGKTSLLSVVARLADPDSGEVLVDGQILARCSLRSCAKQISMMSSALPLMRGSIRRNLLYRWRDAPDSELRRVIDICRISDVISQFPEGLSAEIKEGGGNLSAGHAARVALGRALVGNPKILLLDEPTLNLDEPTKQVFREVVLRYGGTVLMATHDPQDAAIADVVWRMEKGNIVSVVPGKDFRESIYEPVRIPPWARVGNRH